jgi:signal transduction histidine kinase
MLPGGAPPGGRLRWLRGRLRGRLGGFRQSGLVVTAVVLAAGLVMSAAILTLLRASEKRAFEQAMERHTQATRSALEAEARRYVDAMRLAAAGLAVQPEFSRADFIEVTAPLARMDLHGAVTATFLAPATPDRVAAVQAQWRARGVDTLTLKPTGPGIGPSGEHAFAVVQRSLDGSPEVVPGNDVRTPELADALVRSSQTDTATVSEPYVLMRDRGLAAPGQQQAFVLTQPVRDTAGRMAGWLVLSMRGGDFLTGVLPRATQGLLDVSVQAGTARREVARFRQDNGRHDLYREVTIPVADRRWVVNTSARGSRLLGGQSQLDVGLAGAGLVLTGLLAALVYVLATSRGRLASRIGVATAELRTAESEARRQAGLLGAVMESLSDGVGVVDERGEFLMHNTAAKKLFGIEEDATTPGEWQAHYGILRADGRTPFPSAELPLYVALRGEARDNVEMVIQNRVRREPVWVDVSARPLDPKGGQAGAVAVFHDMTERRRAQRAIERLNADLRRLNEDLEQRVADRTAELAAKTAALQAHTAEQAIRAGEREAHAEMLRVANAELESFSYSVSHDLRAPLRAIDGFAKMLILDHGDRLDATGRRYLDKVRSGAQQMGQLIDGLLAFSRLQRQEMIHGRVRVATLVDDVWEELAADRAGREIHLSVNPLPPATGDPRLLRHVVANLLGNAVKYTRGREVARIEVGVEPDGSDGRVAYFVRDNGTGFDMRYADKLFQVFQRLHRAEDYEGTGIGLALAYQIVCRHGGRMWATSAPDQGATFYFTLAGVPTEESDHGPPADPGAAGGRQPERSGAGTARV